MNRVSKSSKLFLDGGACSQAILSIYGCEFGLSRKTAMQLAAGFAGGMRLGSVCGAVTGAIMVLGLRYGSENCAEPAGRVEVYSRVIEFENIFKEMNGSLHCRELLGCDISTPEGMEHAKEHNLFKTTCVTMVENASRILEGLLAESRHAVPADGQVEGDFSNAAQHLQAGNANQG